ncbi:DUF3427 domain-containing protein [Nesterenkonia sp. NBAIMH1]|uniref:DUF3427 domain-containing protein n=1 Tax=Nesterenkonia sp. NBAIMH1 TaxID=2600320 RepID=UPI001AEF60F8|nr:DUF3427 domain-containing protein [Nesterenkonia sp. NBAIMH1]
MLKQDLLEFDGRGLIVTSDYLHFNQPSVFADLLHLRELGKDIDVQIHHAGAFHPKGYIFRHGRGVTALIGSSNLTEAALTRNHEWNLKVSAADGSDLGAQLARLENEQRDASNPLSKEWIEEYRAIYEAQPAQVWREALPRATPPAAAATGTIQPNSMQREALEAIEEVREQGKTRAVVISATGTGKTILSALDVRAYAPQRLLFLVHREQIIDRTIEEYHRVLGGDRAEYGKVSGSAKNLEAKYVFATVQSFSRPEVLASVHPEAFDYVLIDEVHRAGAATYQRILERLQPDFLLGMTATPERSDGFNIFELFDYTVPYEIRLNGALDAGLLVPFHYYGVADVTFDDGFTVEADANLGTLVSSFRVEHIMGAINRYSQQGVKTRGLIFCSRREEARQLSDQLNQRRLGDNLLRTRALTGDISNAERAEAVKALEAGELDYLLTVDIFNEGVDIPSVNQVVMLRQTQSAIIFVQQLGRGLRKAEGKDHLTVIDFIGNYTNNYMIPIALFGDQSLNKESMRKNLNAAEEDSFLPGLSSVRFDEIARDRVMRSIAAARLDDLRELKKEVERIQQRVGRPPRLRDFWEQNSVDPVVLATKKKHYPELLVRTIKAESGLSESESRLLHLLSYEVLPAKRLHESVLLERLLLQRSLTTEQVQAAFDGSGLIADGKTVQSAIDTFTLEGYNAGDKKRYVLPVAEMANDGSVQLSEQFHASYERSGNFRSAVDDLLWTAKRRNATEYRHDRVFTTGSQYSRRDVSRLLGWARSNASTMYGYRTDLRSGVAPIFVTLHKGEDVEASVAYEDELLDPSTLRWFTRSRRTLESAEVKAIVNQEVDVHVFVKRDDAEGTDFYYLGEAHAQDAEQTTMPDESGEPLSVVKMLLHFTEPIEHTLFDYFHPIETN